MYYKDGLYEEMKEMMYCDNGLCIAFHEHMITIYPY